MVRYVLNSMTYQLREMIVLGILSCGIGNLACKRNVLPNMTGNVYSSLYVGIVILSSLVLSVQTLLHCTFQECRKQIDEEVEDAFLVRIELQVEKINGKHLSQHVVQEIVITIVFCKARTNAHLSSVVTNKTHDVPCNKLISFKYEHTLITYFIPMSLKILGED